MRAAQILLTISAFEFFGPIFRDYSPSHAFNPDWPGHARVHLVWLLGFMFFSGLANLYLIWFRRPRDVRDLWLSIAWQACNLGGFWIAYLLASSYGGLIVVEGIHTTIPLHQRIVQDPDFAVGRLSTRFMERFLERERRRAAS